MYAIIWNHLWDLDSSKSIILGSVEDWAQLQSIVEYLVLEWLKDWGEQLFLAQFWRTHQLKAISSEHKQRWQLEKRQRTAVHTSGMAHNSFFFFCSEQPVWSGTFLAPDAVNFGLIFSNAPSASMWPCWHKDDLNQNWTFCLPYLFFPDILFLLCCVFESHWKQARSQPRSVGCHARARAGKHR